MISRCGKIAIFSGLLDSDQVVSATWSIARVHNGNQCGRTICSPVTCNLSRVRKSQRNNLTLKESSKRVKFFDKSTPTLEHRSALAMQSSAYCAVQVQRQETSPLPGTFSKPTESHNLRTITWFSEVLGTIASDLCWKDTFEETSSGHAAQKKRILELLFKTSYESLIRSQCTLIKLHVDIYLSD